MQNGFWTQCIFRSKKLHQDEKTTKSCLETHRETFQNRLAKKCINSLIYNEMSSNAQEYTGMMQHWMLVSSSPLKSLTEHSVRDFCFLVAQKCPIFAGNVSKKSCSQAGNFLWRKICFVSSTIPKFINHLDKAVSLVHPELHLLYSKGFCLMK